MTPDQIAQARAMLEAGQTRTQVAAHFGITRYTLRRQIDPAYREATNDAARKRKGREKAARPFIHYVSAMPAEDQRDGERLLREVPADTRGFTARFMGDPLPGRSAFDRKQEVAHV